MKKLIPFVLFVIALFALLIFCGIRDERGREANYEELSRQGAAIEYVAEHSDECSAENDIIEVTLVD